MKIIRIITISIFFVILLLPVLFFNTKPNQVSEIDNRKLQDFPTADNSSGDYTKDIENYVNDRIGGRDEMINAYAVLNDKAFNVMVHPSYSYGKNGYVFLKTTHNVQYDNSYSEFVRMIKKMEVYCRQRGVPFLFCLQPYKGTVMPQYLESGLNYDDSWRGEFRSELDEWGVNYIDNTDVLTEKSEDNQVYNVKYDAGHWNYIGAFYGVNNMLSAMHDDCEEVLEIPMEHYELSYENKTSLIASSFKINEDVPLLTSDTEIEDLTFEYISYIDVNPTYSYFHYWVNNDAYDLPKTLVFQGSYMNEIGRNIFKDGVHEYIAVHNYQNVYDLDYYFNIFQPEYVVFEVAEYTMTDAYFNYEHMKNLSFNPAKETLEFSEQASEEDIHVDLVNEGRIDTFIVEGIPEECVWAYIDVNDKTLDLIKYEQGIYKASLADNNISVGEKVIVYYVIDDCIYNLVIMTE